MQAAPSLSKLNTLTLAFLATTSCGSPQVQSPEVVATQRACPSTERVLEDIKQIEEGIGALNSLSATPNAEDPSGCSVEVQLGKGSVVWAAGVLDYRLADGHWILANDKPTFQKTNAGVMASVQFLVDETCACTSAACLEAVSAKAKRSLDSSRFLEVFRNEQKAFATIEARVSECTQRVGALERDSDIARKAKTEEAKQLVQKMSDGARMYYTTPRSDGQGPSLPESAGPTPPLGTCCSDGGQCKSNQDDWLGPTWTALDFAMHDPHYYSYEFIAELAEDGKLSYTAIAHGDLDCDGVYSRFSMQGRVETKGEIRAMELIEQNPLE